MSYIFGVVIITCSTIVAFVFTLLVMTTDTSLPKPVNFTETTPLNPNTTLIPTQLALQSCVDVAQTVCSNLTTGMLFAIGNLTIRTAQELNNTKQYVIGNCSDQIALLEAQIANVTQRNPPILLQSGVYSVSGGGSGPYQLYKWKLNDFSLYYALVTGTGLWTAAVPMTLSFSPPLCNASWVSGGVKPLLPMQIAKFQPSNVVSNAQVSCTNVIFGGTSGSVGLNGQLNIIV